MILMSTLILLTYTIKVVSFCYYLGVLILLFFLKFKNINDSQLHTMLYNVFRLFLHTKRLLELINKFNFVCWEPIKNTENIQLMVPLSVLTVSIQHLYETKHINFNSLGAWNPFSGGKKFTHSWEKTSDVYDRLDNVDV